MEKERKKQVFIIHARPVSGTGWAATRGATFAIKRGRFGWFYTAVALCGKKDNFNRKIGRTIAMQRLEKRKLWHGRKGLSSVLRDIQDLCSKKGYLLPVSSVVYIEETFNGKSIR